MKKGLCIVLSALMIAFSFASCGKKDVSDKPTKIDENGSAYVEVTDKDGNKVTSVLSDKDKAKADKNAAKDNKETTTADTSELLSKVEAEASKVTNIDEKNLVSDKKDLISGGTEIKKTSMRDEIIAKTLKSGKFTLKMKMKTSSGVDNPVSLVFNGKKFAADITLNDMQVRAIFDNDNFYMVLPALKVYIKTSSDEAGNIGDLTNITDSNATYVGSTKVTVNGTEYTCEEYKSDNDSVVKYYFSSKKEWKRMEIINGEDVSIFEIESLSNKVDESVFSLKGYTDMTALAMGQANITTTTKKS
ncbi:MAG TPA: hypothetical protein DD393_05660 [Ruminococcaceae bacterium]|jgi:hypothetical protein|nr:hypothetical protein [Oscillospiraceae bacterium]